MAKNDVPNVNFKGFMADSAQTDWNAVKLIYSDGDPKSIYGCIHVFSTSLQAWIGDPKIFLTILVVSIQTNMQRLQRRENNG